MTAIVAAALADDEDAEAWQRLESAYAELGAALEELKL